MQVIIELPGIKAVSRNETGGHYFAYRERLMEAEKWMSVYGKAKEYHFTKPVDVLVEAYYKTGGHRKTADTPNIDDKIFTDVLVRWKRQKLGPPIEKRVWFIEDDSYKYLRRVVKQAIPADQYKVVLTIEEING